MLADISADCYLRLEQGRDRNPSIQVLESLARVLQLGDTGTAYLLSLGSDRPRRARRRPRKEAVPSGNVKLLDSLTLPAFLEGRYFDVLAANPLATVLSPHLVTGRNRLRDVFLDPAEQSLYPAGEDATAGLVAGFRQSVGTDTDDLRFIELVGELSLASDRFRQLWARHDVHAREGTSVTLDHPQVGELTLNREKRAVSGSAGLLLVVYHADRNTQRREAPPPVLLPNRSPHPGTHRPRYRDARLMRNPRRDTAVEKTSLASTTNTKSPTVPTPTRFRGSRRDPHLVLDAHPVVRPTSVPGSHRSSAQAVRPAAVGCGPRTSDR
ncbi:transcriptional regulator [Streptomyces sp. NPDC087228]|uniref:MmyB family transcriptional regulator n=1 Tax=Streptomyces sp. NPDC087228 TaxID=3365772 RepID=UPI0037F4A896